MQTHLSEFSVDGLLQSMHQEWDVLLSKSRAMQAIRQGDFDLRFYAIYLTETYHYASHNAANQALVATRNDYDNTVYKRFCYEHSMEETGHELMAFHDLKSLGITMSRSELPSPLPNTETLIGYLYYISMHGNPLRRLGYSFWSENSYEYFMPIVGQIKERFQLERKNLTFFIQHSELDDGHAEEIQKQIRLHARTEDDWRSIEEVMKTSLQLAMAMFESTYQEFLKLRQGESNKYQCVNVLKGGMC